MSATLTWSLDGIAQSIPLRERVARLPEVVADALGFTHCIHVGPSALLVGETQTLALASQRPVGAEAWPRARVSGWKLVLEGALPRRAPVALADDPTHALTTHAAPAAALVLEAPTGELDGGSAPVLVGRHPACDVRLDDRLVSSFHCVLAWQRDGVRVIDLDSANGTWVGTTRTSDVVVRQGTLLRVGETQLPLRVPTEPRREVELGSKAMQKVYDVLARVAPSDASVVLHGESGVGKDHLARRLHALSARPGLLVTLNAAVLKPELAASELFGHVRGAFTGAHEDRVGAFAAADRGTLFLDEIAELALEVQAELLRTVELRVVRRMGEPYERPVDVRLVVATHKSLEAEVRAGRFREDLFHRLAVIVVPVPALRDRPEDVVDLAMSFLSAQDPPRTLSPAARDHLCSHAWPGNARELFNVLRRACLLSHASVLAPADLALAPAGRMRTPIDELLHRAVLEAYHANDQDVAATARRLGLRRDTVYRHLKAARGRRVRFVPRADE